jgi:hypothetical protein
MVAAVALLAAARAAASVVVIANRMPEAVTATVVIDGAQVQTLKLDPGDSRPVFADAAVRVRLPGNLQDYQLAPDCAYFIGPDVNTGGPTLAAIGLGETGQRPWPGPNLARAPALADAGVITVKVFVDDDELRLQQVWEPALRERIAKASDILAAHGGPRFKIVGFGAWDSDDADNDFSNSLREFEQEASPAPAQVALGFTSQYAVVRGRFHMGGTRGPLHTHVLIKERARNVLEPEKLELLVHELGHLAGASHSPEPESVMRPVLTGGLQRRAGAQVRFDPVNTLLISLVGDELRRGVRSLSNCSPDTRRRLREIYAALEPTMPDDPATGHYLQLVRAAEAIPLLQDTRQVLSEIVRVAALEKQRLETEPAIGADRGERLLEFYVRQAALAAKRVRRENGPRAFALAIGFALDDQGLLASLPITGTVAQQLESDHERRERIAVLGTPTMRRRNDLAKHFFVSVHLTALAGSEAARTAGLAKELRDAQNGSGFSFRDLMADRAGVMFANAVINGRLSLDDVAAKFSVEACLPPLDDLREDMDAAAFAESFGGLADPRFLAEVSLIDGRIMGLPAYGKLIATPPTP